MAGDAHDLELVERDLERVDVCRAVRIIAGLEWICVAKVHDDPPRPGHGQRSAQTQLGYWPRSERHYFRRRYPDTGH